MIEPTIRGAWCDLEAKLRPFVARRVRSAFDVDDVVQDVLLRIQRGVGAIRDRERFGPWVYQVARSAIADHRRVVARHPHADHAPADEPAPPQDGDGALERELATYVARRVPMLASPYREALTLTELEGLTQREAAKMMAISASGMKSRIQRGRRQLRAALEECCRIALDARQHVLSCEPHAGGSSPDGCCRTHFNET